RVYVKKVRKIDGLPSRRARFKCKLFPAFFINAKAVSILAKSRNFAYSAIPICNPGPSQILKRNGCLPYTPTLCLSKGKTDELFLRKTPPFANWILQSERTGFGKNAPICELDLAKWAA
ncbi:hypothetical protein P9695_08405, partial [Weizmannia sp. CD-2023]|uniref:hypothetical protein n=1 Tax=Weizmannia sp. CD-2023 TaxID=3037263 RepID=UPI002E1A760C|nr:hypothetical protein [Weizmannia sp. CD-2023]